MGAYLHILLNFSAEFLIKYYTVSLSYNLQIYFYYRVPKGNVVHTNIYLIQLQNWSCIKLQTATRLCSIFYASQIPVATGSFELPIC